MYDCDAISDATSRCRSRSLPPGGRELPQQSLVPISRRNRAEARRVRGHSAPHLVPASRTCNGERHSEFVGLTDDELLALIQDPATPSRLRRKAIREAKFRGLRNVRKRRNR